MKTITKLVNIKDRKFVLIQIEAKDIEKSPLADKLQHMINQYGTLPYEYITNGKTNRALSFGDLNTASTIAEALENREMTIEMENMTIAEKMAYIERKFEAR